MFVFVCFFLAGIVLWKLAGEWEWDIPQKWESRIFSWQENFGKTAKVNYIWQVEPDNPELERDFFKLKRSLRQSCQDKEECISIQIEVIPQARTSGKTTYLTCLQRSYPELSGELDGFCHNNRGMPV